MAPSCDDDAALEVVHQIAVDVLLAIVCTHSPHNLPSLHLQRFDNLLDGIRNIGLQCEWSCNTSGSYVTIIHRTSLG